MTQRWKITIEYDGGFYFGWQRQKNEPSVQQSIEEAISAWTGQKSVTLHVAGRTDAGVHSLGQVAHFDSEKDLTEKSVRDGTNAKLYELGHKGIYLRKAELVTEEFHARFSAVRREYCYRIVSGRYAPLALSEKRVWHIKQELDVESMRESAQFLLGKHDFTSFRGSGCQGNTPIKTLEKIDIKYETDNLFYKGQYIEVHVTSKSFLYHQVRNIVGSLVAVGRKKWQPEQMKEVLEACDRTKAASTAPAHGLYFMQVYYSNSTYSNFR